MIALRLVGPQSSPMTLCRLNQVLVVQERKLCQADKDQTDVQGLHCRLHICPISRVGGLV
jgi:hypothetical protein